MIKSGDKIKTRTIILLSLFLSYSFICCAQPPYSGTVFIHPDIITDTDPTTYQSLSYIGQDIRTMYDYRTNSFNENNAFLFSVTYSDGFTVEFQVNPEFSSVTLSQEQVEIYAPAIESQKH